LGEQLWGLATFLEGFGKRALRGNYRQAGQFLEVVDACKAICQNALIMRGHFAAQINLRGRALVILDIKSKLRARRASNSCLWR